MEQWVKDSTAAAQVTVEVWVLSLAQGSRLKNPTWVQSLAWEFPYAMGETIKKKKRQLTGTCWAVGWVCRGLSVPAEHIH